MQKRADTNELDIPQNDIECWERYPKHRWVYDLSRLLDAQSIKWSPYETNELHTKVTNLNIVSDREIDLGAIYIKEPTGNDVVTEMYIIKGEIKLMRHIDLATLKGTETLNGQVELRLNAFSTLYFQKYTGVVTVQTYGNEIMVMKLMPYPNLNQDSNQEIAKILKRIYKRSESE